MCDATLESLIPASWSTFSSRWISAAWWVIASLVLFLLVYRATGSLLLAVAAHYLGLRSLGFIARVVAVAIPIAGQALYGTSSQPSL